MRPRTVDSAKTLRDGRELERKVTRPINAIARVNKASPTSSEDLVDRGDEFRRRLAAESRRLRSQNILRANERDELAKRAHKDLREIKAANRNYALLT